MKLLEVYEKVGQHTIDKKSVTRELWVEYVKGAVTILLFLAGLALVSNFINIYFAVKYGFGLHQQLWYGNLALIVSMVAYLFVFVSAYKKLGLRITDRIDDLNSVIDDMDKIR